MTPEPPGTARGWDSETRAALKYFWKKTQECCRSHSHVAYHGDMAHDMTPEEKDGIHAVMVALAGHCDGARERDFVGFNGVDTHFGRRIALVPRSQWTDEIWAECAHIVLKYRQQGITYTGIDVGTFQAVKDAQDVGTNHTARRQAHAFEKRAKHLDARQIGVVRNRKGQQMLGIRWANGDPDFDTFLGLVKALPGREWIPESKTNAVLYTPQVDAFINEWDFTLTENGQAFVEDARNAETIPAPAPQVSYEVWLHTDGRIRIKTNLTAPGQPASDAVRALPGRSFDKGLYANSANAHPQVLAFARQFGLNVHPDAVRACEAAGLALAAQDASGLSQTDVATVMNTVSRCGKPEDLPAAFVMILKEILP